jgi:hypothetical protein
MNHRDAPVSVHNLHIPVMGTGFTIDAPLKLAKYGISSAISLVDDVLIEQMRRHHAMAAGEPFTPIGRGEQDARAKRITAYINLLHRQVSQQLKRLREEPFIPGSDITRYFELLPDSALRRAWRAMLAEDDPELRWQQQNELRRQVAAGSIDANIMTKMDLDTVLDGVKQPPEMTAAQSALRGFANSRGRGAMIFSAGFNPRLYSYAATFDCFYPADGRSPRKRIILKVSDYRSALIQGKFLAKLGLWVSEFRVESGLNCGGHAFAAKGQLLGPVLAEFCTNRSELYETLWKIYVKALAARDCDYKAERPVQRLTAQGGITTAQENASLIERYGLDGTGWGTPFLMVPEVTNVDARHLRKLARARPRDVRLSDVSPMGVPFWTLRDSASELQKQRRIRLGRPGSPCPKGMINLNTEFTTSSICTASREYQRLKLADLRNSSLSRAEYRAAAALVTAKSCICHDLAGAATLKLGIDNRAAPAICCGPSIVRFSRVYTLDEMLGHAYGRTDLFAGRSRSHMFIEELKLSVAVLRADVRRLTGAGSDPQQKQLQETRENLLQQIGYYQDQWAQAMGNRRHAMSRKLRQFRRMLENLPLRRVRARATVRID